MEKNILMIKKLIILLVLGYSTASFAQTKLPSFFSNNMVLQQNEKVSIWGTDNPGTVIAVSGSWGSEGIAVADKAGKWKVKIKTPVAGGPYTVTVKGSQEVALNNVLMGEVWLCSGQSNMEMPIKGFRNQPINGSNEAVLTSNNSNIRLFTTKKNSSLEPLNDVTGSWKVAAPASTGEFSATAYFFGRKLEEILKVPIGLIVTSWGGSKVEAWINKETLAEFKYVKLPKKMPKERHNHTPTLLYNAMINPFIGYNIKGAIWYQGESNRENAEEYKELFPTMIELWREKWNNGSFPFYFVQIAPFGYKGLNAAFVRESQLNTVQTLENTGMAVTMDIGDCVCIHPAEKKTVGDRLAYWALSNDYNIGGVAYSGPVFKDMEKKTGSRVELFFDYCPNGLSSFGKPLTGFEVAGKDKVFYPGKAKINGNRTLTVWSEDVDKPVAVRYAFESCVEGTLFNIEGLPASSFRTDNWTGKAQ
jgi:sialate O-acetylesterase